MARAQKPAHSPGLSDKQLVALAQALGAVGPKVISPSTVETGNWVRLKCEFGCTGYGKCLTCPPHTPMPDRTRKMLDEYKRGILLEIAQGKTRRLAVDLERQLFLQGYYKAFAMSSGPCDLCDDCGITEGCRHPSHSRPAMEACGIDVYATVRKHGFFVDVIRGPKDPQHYFALVLVE